jgi:hypothetical protein
MTTPAGTIDLSSYSSIASAMFVKIVFPDVTFLTSDFNRPITIGTDTYTGLGQMLTITDSQSELKATEYGITIGISGIPTENVNYALTERVKGADVYVLRAIFDPTTGQLLNVPNNPIGKFQGIVNNYSIDETWKDQDSTISISLICASRVGQLDMKVAGRRTNEQDMRNYFPGDASMDRVGAIANAKLDFGKN